MGEQMITAVSTWDNIRVEMHQRVLDARCVEALIMSHIFEKLWESSTIPQRETALSALAFFNREGLRQWIENHPSIELEDLSLHRLKAIARQLRVVNYSRLDHSSLLIAIREKQDGHKQTGLS
jgi:hypothetical protein